MRNLNELKKIGIISKLLNFRVSGKLKKKIFLQIWKICGGVGVEQRMISFF